MGHRLFVLPAIGRQYVAHAIEGLAHPRDIAVPEDGENATEERLGVFRVGIARV